MSTTVTPPGIDYFKHTELCNERTKNATDLSGVKLYRKFECPVACSKCLKEVTGSLWCNKCEAFLYCSRECQLEDWNFGSEMGGGVPHKEICSELKKQMKLLPEMREILNEFPWGVLSECIMGWFPEPNILHDFGLLSPKVSYWSHYPDIDAVVHVGSTKEQNTKLLFGHTPAAKAYIDGAALLESSWASEKDSWLNLQDSHIPWYNFSSRKPPVPLTDRSFRTWAGWYEWRGLPLESPVALVMHRVLTLYFILTRYLNIGPLLPNDRMTLKIAMMASEGDLNSLPLMAELALLLPGYDFELTFIGDSVDNIFQRARVSSLAAKIGPVFKYDAPDKSSSVSVSLYGFGRAGKRFSDFIVNNGDVHAAIALNAGVREYQTDLNEMLKHCMTWGIPVLLTDHAELYVKTCKGCTAKALDAVLAEAIETATTFLEMPGEMGDLMQNRDIVQKLTRKAAKSTDDRWPVTINEFMKPGQKKNAPMRLPNCENGFVVEVLVKKV